MRAERQRWVEAAFRARALAALTLLAASAAPACGNGDGDGKPSSSSSSPSPVCGAGTADDAGACVADVVCPDAAPFDPSTGACTLSAQVCGAGTVLDGGRCLPAPPPEPPLPPIDRDEAPEPNDRAGAAGQIPLPAAGAPGFTIHGCIAPYADSDGNGTMDADLDAWSLHAASPALLQIAALGVGGMQPAFTIDGSDLDLAGDDWTRVRADTRDGHATWQLLLPEAGDYQIGVQDAGSLLSAGLAVGGPGSCYFLTFTRLAMPAPAALPASLTTVSLDAPSFYAFNPARRGDGLDVAAETSRTGTLASIVLLVNGTYLVSASESDLGAAEVTSSFDLGDRVVVVVEAMTAFSPPAEPADFLATRVAAP